MYMKKYNLLKHLLSASCENMTGTQLSHLQVTGWLQNPLKGNEKKKIKICKELSHLRDLSAALSVTLPLLQPEQFLWHPTDTSPAFVPRGSNRWETELTFGGVPVAAWNVSPAPAGNHRARSCVGQPRGSSPSRAGPGAGLGAWPGLREGYPKTRVCMAEQLWHDGEREWEVSVVAKGTQKRGVCCFFISLQISWACWRTWSLLWRQRCREQELKCRTSKERALMGLLSDNLLCCCFGFLIFFSQHCKLPSLTSALPLPLPTFPPLLPLMLVSSFPLLYTWPFHYVGISISLINMWNRYADDLICWVL